ncbi:Methyltransferase type 11 [Actinobacteria bacterium OK074]|nr:Methyltransferase type 11 [Actinobacteria bacterium OK074]
MSQDVESSPDRTELNAYYRKLIAELWHPDGVTPAGVRAAPELVASLDTVDRARRPHVAFVLGLLAETALPDGAPGPLPAVRAGLDRYLALAATAGDDEPLLFALLYLLGHFPADRDRILRALTGLPLPLDLARLDRSLRLPDPDDPTLGRVWPSPALWQLDEAERAVDRQWIGALPPERFTALWEYDTRSLLAYSGAKALWAVEHGPLVEPAPTYGDAALSARKPTDGGVPEHHRAVLRCPGCRSPLVFAADTAVCAGCGSAHPVADGIVDLSAGVGDDSEAGKRNVPPRYEAALRPAFLRIMGGNWNGAVTVADEDRYLRERVRPVAGPVLDLAAGAGRWTGTLARAVGPERVIAVDLSSSMLGRLHQALPDVLAVRASAHGLPFADATLGAVNCWNALQAIPDPAKAISEVGRCLRPGGTFTLFTFRPTADPVVHHFQNRVHPGVSVPGLAAVRGWLESAGMSVREQSCPASFLFLTAVREK